MKYPFQRWPFWPLHLQTPEQNARWWAECFTLLPAVEQFIQVEGSAALLAGPGNGKTTATAALERFKGAEALIIPYRPDYWPRGAHAWERGGSHITQVMGRTATQVVELLQKEPLRFESLNLFDREFLAWLVRQHLGRRILTRLQRHLAAALPDLHWSVDQVEALYSGEMREADVWSQLAELADLAQSLGYQRVVVSVDLDIITLTQNLDNLLALLGWLHLLEHPGWALKLTLPYTVEIQRKLEAAARGRLHLYRLYMDEATVDAMSQRYLQVATQAETHALDLIADHSVIQRGWQEVKALYDGVSLAGWLRWVETLLALSDRSAAGPLSNADEAIYAYYERHIPLRLVEGWNGVWRGPQFIPLDRQPMEIMRKLFVLKGQSDSAFDVLQKAAGGSSTYLNTLMSRLRKIIEPVKDRNLYIRNRRDMGYWLENFIEQQPM